MQCKSCGAQLTIHDFTCPYCGTQNPEAEAYYKQHQKDVLERDAKIARSRAEVEKTRLVTDLRESVEGSRKAMRFLTGLLILCGIVSALSLATYAAASWQYEQLVFYTDRGIAPSGSAAEYLQMEQQYEEAGLHECFTFHGYVNAFYQLTDEGDVPDVYLFRHLTDYGADAWDCIHPKHDWQQVDEELAAREETYMRNFFRQNFGYEIEDCWFLTPEEGYLPWEKAEEAGKELRKRFLEVR